MAYRSLSRREVTLILAAGVLSSCTVTEPPRDPPSGERTNPSDAGGSGSDDGGKGEPTVDMTQQALAEHPFDGLTVTRVPDGPLHSWELAMLRKGQPMLSYRLQGEWDGEAPQVDGFQRMEEARALDAATSHAGDVIIPRSNWEFAFQLVVDGDAQFVPYHGSATAFASRSATIRIDGEEIDPDSIPPGQAREVDEFVLEQAVVARHPARAGVDLVEIQTTTTWTSDGMGRVSGDWKALEDVQIGSMYGPMLPFSRDVFDTVETDSESERSIVDEDDTETVALANATTARAISSETGWTAAITWDSSASSAPAGTAGVSELFLQLRPDGIGKLYPQLGNEGDLIRAGETWQIGAHWAVTAP